MAIDKASRQRFEAALPSKAGEPLWQLLATPDDRQIGKGEYVYVIPVWKGSGPGRYLTNKRITVRSSIGRDDYFADTDQNSIRMWVEYFWPKRNEWYALGKGDTGVYTTRVKGWEGRMTEKLRDLYQLALDDESGRSSRGTMPVPEADNAPESSEEAPPPAEKLTSAPPEGRHYWEYLSGSEAWACLRCGRTLQLADYPSAEVLPTDPCDGGEAFNEKWAEMKNEFARQEAKEEEAAFKADLTEPKRRERQTTPQSDDAAHQARMALQTTHAPRTRKQVAEEWTERTPNDGQLAAIQSDIGCAARVLAPPGSGKTFVIELRNAFLIQEGVNPGRIVNVTLTKNMADDGKRRVLDALHRQFPELQLNEFSRWFCTIHALCFRILREEGDSREVLGNGLIKKVVQHLAELHWPRAEERPGWKEVYRYVNGAKNAGLASADDLEFFISVAGPFHGRILHDIRREFDNILAGAKRYELNDWLKEKLGKTLYVTFPDMLLEVELRLQRDTQFRQRWQDRFEVVNVDEGQDTNGQAMRILRTLSGDQFYIVGDTDQLLFRFAGATPEENLYEGFEAAFPGGLTHKLLINYRSTRHIINTCNRLIAHNYVDLGGPYEEAYRKEIVPREDASEGNPVTFTMYADAHREAQAVVELVQELYDEGHRSYGDIFIGARTRAQLGYLEGPLVRAGIPFINATGGSFWKSKHVQDVVAYLRLAHDAGDKEAFRRVYNISSNYMTVPWRNAPDKGEYCTTRYLGHAFLAACDDDYRNVHRAVERKSSWEYGVDDLTGLMAEIKGSLMVDGVAAAMEAVLDFCYIKYLRADEGLTAADESEDGKVEDLRTAIDIAGEFGDDAEGFLAHVDEMIKAAEAAAAKDWDGFLVISTVHGLKGQERPVMIGVGLVEFIVVDPMREQPGGLLPHTFSLIAPPDDGVLPGPGRGKVSDERDIAYVLVSRAKEECFLTGPGKYRGRWCEPSRFVREMGLADIPVVDMQPADDGQTTGDGESAGAVV
jgi:DNA helicase-2/ATP-dependent DNA helicase PcrA